MRRFNSENFSRITTTVSVMVLGCALGACGTKKETPAPPLKDRPNILLISVDTLRADHLGMYGYKRKTSPRIDEWFKDGLVFETAYAAEANTTPSCISFLSGLLPQDHRVRLLYQKVPEDLKLVSDRLRSDGYQTAAVVSNMVLTTEATALQKHFDYYDDYVFQKENSKRRIYERSALPTTDAALKWFNKKKTADRPYFMWVHYIDPHGPYTPPKNKPTDFSHDFPNPVDIDRIPGYQRHKGVEDGNEYVDLYDEEIAYTDREIGRLLDALKAEKALDNTYVVFTSDHGESLMDHERWFLHGYHVYDELIRVPLAIIGPKIPSKRVSVPVTLMDITPTMLNWASSSISEKETAQLLGPNVKPKDLFAEATHNEGQWRMLRRGDKKWAVLIDRDNGRKKEYRLYNLKSDPKEESAAKWTKSDAAEETLLSLIKEDPDKAGYPKRINWGGRIKAPKVAPGLDDTTLERLKALGYVEE